LVIPFGFCNIIIGARGPLPVAGQRTLGFSAEDPVLSGYMQQLGFIRP
jgi:hypothetical protein